VTDFEPGKGFVWESRSAGIHSKAEHWIEETGGGECQVTLVLNQTGFLSALLSPFVSGLVRRYVHTEAVGLKKRSEEQGRTSQP